MALTIMRTAHSGIVKDAMDYSTAFCDRRGQVIAQGLTITLHLGSFSGAVRSVLERYDGAIEPEDMYILNDPYGSGGIHLPDIYVIKPVFVDDELQGFAATVAHHTDVGGIVPGSNSTDSVEVYQEGLRIPTLKLYDRGAPSEAIFAIIEKNVRVPDKVLGDMRAQIAALNIGEREFHHLAGRYGAATVRRYMDALLDYTEGLAREEILRLPDGTYEFTDYIDADNIEEGPVVIHVKLTIRGDRVMADLEGSSPQVKAGINSPLTFTKSAVYGAVRLVMDPDIPNAEGYQRLIEVRAPKASVVAGELPAACGARGITGFRVMDAVMGALGQAVPDRVPADGDGGNTIISIGGYHADGEPFAFVDLICGVRGGRPAGDGPEGVPHPGSNISNTPVEIAEVEQPVRIEAYGPDPGHGRARQVPRGAVADAAGPMPGRRGDAPASVRQATLPALRSTRGQAGRPVVEHPEPRRRPDDTADARRRADEAGRRAVAHDGQRRRMGRPAGARPGARPGRRPQRAADGGARASGVRGRHRPGELRDRPGSDRTPPRRAQGPPRVVERWAGLRSAGASCAVLLGDK